ncbi:hypothetical protein SDC9_120583 [bioreactor metagenome]|uniref:Uncharacterized protein n=1 Tax=bioreactor metagenome TaxID=1076179 RepID=A0A645C8C8_9ZZZZ
MLDVVSGLDRASQLLEVGGGVLHPPQLGAVEPDALGYPVDGLASDLSAQVQVHIHPLAGVDESGHPAAPDRLGIAVLADVEVGVVGAIHDGVARVGQVQAPGRHKVDGSDSGHRVQPDDFLFGRHGVHHHPVQPLVERLLLTGLTVKVHIEDLRHKGVLVLGLHDVVARLGEVGAGVLGRGLKGAVNFAVVRVQLAATAGGLILEDEEEPA